MQWSPVLQVSRQSVHVDWILDQLHHPCQFRPYRCHEAIPWSQPGHPMATEFFFCNVWEEAKRQVEGYSQNEYEGFHTEVEALQYLVGTGTALPAVESQGPAEKQQVPTYQSVNMYEVLPTSPDMPSPPGLMSEETCKEEEQRAWEAAMQQRQAADLQLTSEEVRQKAEKDMKQKQAEWQQQYVRRAEELQKMQRHDTSQRKMEEYFQRAEERRQVAQQQQTTQQSDTNQRFLEAIEAIATLGPHQRKNLHSS